MIHIQSVQILWQRGIEMRASSKEKTSLLVFMLLMGFYSFANTECDQLTHVIRDPDLQSHLINWVDNNLADNFQLSQISGVRVVEI